MKKFIEEANLYLEKNHLNKFPYGISAPIIAQFAYSVISNNLNLSKEDLKLQAKIFLQEWQLEEVNYCLDDFTSAMADFTSLFINNQTKIHQVKC